MHKGVDLPASVGTPIHATADGIVGRADWFSSYGLYVAIEHGGNIETRYGHMSRLNVAAGQLKSTRATSSVSSAPPAVRPARTCITKCASPVRR